MKLIKSKAGKLTSGMINTALMVLVLIVVLFEIYAGIMPTAQAAGDSMNASNQCVDYGCHWNASETNCYTDPTQAGICSASGLPFASLFSSGGAVFIVVMAALIILVIKGLMPSKK